MSAGNPHRYHSSPEKNLIREQFDLPLLEQLHSIRGESLGYFGLPGEDLRDIRCWRHLLGEVAAVDFDSSSLLAIDQTVKMEMPELRFTPYLGDVDRVILNNRGMQWDRGGQPHRPLVGRYDMTHRQNGWYFDVVNLDYYGPFLPERGQAGARRRADAIRKLFDVERLDARGRWVLMVTVEASLLRPTLNMEILEYLQGVKDEVNAETTEVLDFLTQPLVGANELFATRLVHGTTASLISRAASNLSVMPRGTILYKGSNDQPMIHVAYEFEPVAGPLPPPTTLLGLLKSPILTISQINNRPGITLLGAQPPSMTEMDARNILDFLDGTVVDRIVAQLN